MEVPGEISVKKQIAVIGAGTCNSDVKALAEKVGREIANKGN